MKYLLLAAACLTAAPGFAQSAAAPATAAAGDAGFDEIIVTAQKRAEKLSEVPITVTAYTGERLEAIGVNQFDQLSAFAPGLNVQEQSPNNPGFVIRGITSDSGSSQDSPRVTIYYNGVDVSRSRGSYFDLFDIERVEVVKGPQPSLFGTASAIGAVSVISKHPTGELGGDLRAAYGNFDQFKLSGALDSGGEYVQARLAFAYKRRDGYVRNIAGDPGSQNPGGKQVDDLNGQNQVGIRGSLRFKPTSELTVDFVATYDGQDAPGTAFKSGTLPPTGGQTSPYSFAEVAGSPFSQAVLGYDQPHLTRNVYDLNATIVYDPDGPFSFTSITGYRKFDSNEVFDADGSQAWYLEFAEDSRGQQISHEDRIAYDSGQFRGFVGFNVFHETGSQRVPFSTEEGTYLQCAARLIPGLGCVDVAGVVTAARATALLTRGAASVLPYSAEFKNGARLTTYSAFVDATYIPTPRLELTLGGRITYEERLSRYSARQPNSLISGAPLLPVVDTRGQTYDAADDFTAFLPRGNILFRATDQVNLYATVSKGRRSPIVQLASRRLNGLPVAARTDIPAEIVWNYEGGIKGGFGFVSGSIAGFYQTYENFQVSVIENGVAVTRNAGSAKNYGIEAEIAARPVSFLNLFANAGYINAKIDNKAQNGVFANQRFRLQPEWQAAGGATVTLPLSPEVEGFATPTVTYRSSLFFELPNNPVTSQGPVTLVNLRAGIRSPDGRWELLGFATNLSDEEYLIDAGNTGGSFGIPTFIRAQPRLFGIEGAVRF